MRFDLTDKVAPFRLGEEVGNIKLGALGEAMYKLMDLDKIDEADLAQIVELAQKCINNLSGSFLYVQINPKAHFALILY